MRRWVGATLAAFAIVVGALVMTTAPASADDCKTLVRSVLDLTDKAKVEDCLRTGGNWGRVIGTVVGGAGVVIAGLGLLQPSRPAQAPPAPSRSHQQLPDTPCARLPARGHRIHELDVARRQLEAQIVEEFHKHSDQAQYYLGMYRQLQAAWYKARQCLFAARALNGAWWGAGIVAIAAVLKAAAAYWALAPAAAVPAQTAAEFAAAKALALKELTLGAVGTVAALGKDITGEGTPDWLPGVKPWSDPWAEAQRQALINQLRPVATAYADAATAFNRSLAQWGVDRQADLDRILQEIREEAARYNADAAACPDSEGVPPPPPAGSDAPPMQLQLPQVPTDFDELWLAGGTWDVFQ